MATVFVLLHPMTATTVCHFYRLQDVEYNSQTFTKLESDLVRGNSDLKSFEKEIKVRKFRSINLRSQRISVNHAAVENFHLRMLAGFDEVFGRTWRFLLRPVLSGASVLVCWHWWDWAVPFGIQSSPTLVRSKVWVSKSASKSESSNWNLCKRPFKCKSEARSSKMLQVVLWVFLDGFLWLRHYVHWIKRTEEALKPSKSKMSFHRCDDFRWQAYQTLYTRTHSFDKVAKIATQYAVHSNFCLAFTDQGVLASIVYSWDSNTVRDRTSIVDKLNRGLQHSSKGLDGVRTLL